MVYVLRFRTPIHIQMQPTRIWMANAYSGSVSHALLSVNMSSRRKAVKKENGSRTPSHKYRCCNDLCRVAHSTFTNRNAHKHRVDTIGRLARSFDVILCDGKYFSRPYHTDKNSCSRSYSCNEQQST